MDISRTQQAALYLAQNIPDLYVVKFLKLLYYLDFVSVKETGRSVTNDVYFHLPYGPIPSFIKDNIDLLDAKVKAEETKIFDPNISGQSHAPSWLNISSIFDNVLQLNVKGTGRVIKPATGVSFNFDNLSTYEKGLLDDIIKEFKNKSVSDVVNKTHQEPPYLQTLMSQAIPYDLAFQLDINQALPQRTFESDKEIAYSRFLSS